MSEPEAVPQREGREEGNKRGVGGSALNAPGKGRGDRRTKAQEGEGVKHITADVEKQQ